MLEIYFVSLIGIFIGLLVYSATLCIQTILEDRAFHKAISRYKISIPSGIDIYSGIYIKSDVKGEVIQGAYLPDTGEILMCCSKNNWITYCSVLFHELSHWAEDSLGMDKGPVVSEYKEALKSADVVTLKKYVIKEVAVDLSSYIIFKVYLNRAKAKSAISLRNLYKQRRKYFIDQAGVKLTRSDYRLILDKAGRLAYHVLASSNTAL